MTSSSHARSSDLFARANAVISGGAWTNSILESAGLPQMNLEIWQVQWAHYEVDPEVAASIPQTFHFRKEIDIDIGKSPILSIVLDSY